MSPQWMPQNIQKRLLLYVLQQLSLFSEIDLPNLEEVSLNNIVLKNVSIDPEKVGKLPGCNLRYGQVGSLELNGGVMGGVNIDANNVEIVIAPDFDMKEEVANNVQFLLAQSTADLANTLFTDKLPNDVESSGDEEETVKALSSKSRSNSSSSSSSAKSKPSALSGVMSRAVEIAFLRLQVKVTNLNIKIVSESTDLLLKVDEVLLNTINGTRHIKIQGVKLITLRPDINPGESSYGDQERSSSTELERENVTDDEDSDNDYGDESLMDSMVFTHEEASSIYMSATSQSFNKENNNDIKDDENVSKHLPILVHIDNVEIEFEGLSSIKNLDIEVGEVKIAAVPVAPTVVSIFSNISHNLKLKYYQQRKQNLHSQRIKLNSSFPQYADDDDEIEDESEKVPLLEDVNSKNLDPFFDRIHINNVIINATSALLPTGHFSSASNSLYVAFHNFNIKYKNETLTYGGIEKFRIVKVTDYRETDVVAFNNNPSSTEAGSSDEITKQASSTSNIPKADIRFEMFVKHENYIKNIEFTSLFSKQAFINLDMPALLLLINFGLSVSTIYENYSIMKTTMALNYSLKNITRDSKDQAPVSPDLNSSSQFILQTSSATIELKTSDAFKLKVIIFPISFNLLKNGMSINKVLISTISNGVDKLISTVSNVQLLLGLQDFKSFVNRSGYYNNNESIPRAVILSSSLTLSVSKITTKLNLQELNVLSKNLSIVMIALETLPLQINSLKKSTREGLTSFSKKAGNVDNSTNLLNSIYSNQRRARRPIFNNQNSTVSNRSNSVSFRLYVEHLELYISNVLPKLGDFDIQFKKLSFYKLNNDISGSVHFINVDRLTESGKKVDHFVYEFQEKKLSEINIPLFLINLKRSEKVDTIVVSVRNILIEYFTQWLELLEREIDENAVLHDITDQKQESNNVDSSVQKRIDIRFSFNDCVVGLNPGRLNCKSLLVINKGNADISFGLHQFYIKTSLRDLSLLIIDDTKNISKADMVNSRILISRYISPLTWFLSSGYISVGTINCTHIGITVNTGIQEIMKKNEDLGIHDNLSLLDIKINSDEHQIDLCADSAHVLMQMISDLKPPLNFREEEKVKIRTDNEINLLDGINEDEFKSKPYLSASIAEDFGDLVNISKVGDSNEINIVDEYYNEMQTSSQSLDKCLNRLNINDSSEENAQDASLVFDEEHFSNTNVKYNSKISPIKFNINLSKTKVYLYDGFDWKVTRKTIKGAVKRVERKALQELESNKYSESRDAVNSNSRIKFEEPIPKLNTARKESHKEYENDNDSENNHSGNHLLIGETLFQSIHLTFPKGSDPISLTRNINKSVQNDMDNENSEDLNINYNIETSSSYKNLKLRRSKNHKISMDLKNIEVNMTIHTTRDPRRDKEIPDATYEMINSVELRIEDVDIYDNIPSSTWNKFLSYMNSLGEKEIGTSMVKASITNVRPDPELCSTEALIDISVLPIRLHVDQEALDFFIRFLEFKDKRFELPIDEIIYIQKFKMSDLKLKLDYKPRKIDYAGIRSGKASELVNFFVLDGSELTLPKLKIYGVLGIPLLGVSLANAWAPNIQKTQLAGLLVGLSPFKSIINIGGGVKDLIAVPIKEYQKDGRLIRSIQKGTSKFAKTTGYELLNLGAKLASGTQVILEQSEEAFGGEGSSARSSIIKLDKQNKAKDNDAELHATVNQNNTGTNLLASSQLLNKSVSVNHSPYSNKKLYSYIELDESDDIDDKILENSLLLMKSNDLEKSKKQLEGATEAEIEALEKEELDEEDAIKLVSLYSNQPENTQQGLQSAYKSLGKNFKITKEALQNLQHDLSASPNVQESLKTLLKSSPVLIIRPMIGTTEALLKALLGISNEIDSNKIIESKDKYRYSNTSLQ